jgi:isocitrate dehydrogenase
LESQILEEIRAASCRALDIGGYYRPDEDKVCAAMRPSQTLNQVIG